MCRGWGARGDEDVVGNVGQTRCILPTSCQKRPTCEQSPDQRIQVACASRRLAVTVKPVIPPQFWQGLVWLVGRAWTSETNRFTVLVEA